MLAIGADPNGFNGEIYRRAAWAATLNSQAAMMSDRNLGSPTNPTTSESICSIPWRGSVLYNDNHVVFKNHRRIGVTRYGRLTHQNEHLFVGGIVNGSDGICLMVYHNSTSGAQQK